MSRVGGGSRVHWWHILLLIVVLSGISVTSLRSNNVRMGELREAVLVADEANEGIQRSLEELANHIFSHMNTDMSQPLNLVASYNRAVEVERKKAEVQSPDGSVYREAQKVCEDPSVLLSVRAQCIQDYVTENAEPTQVITEFKIPPKQSYIFDFAAPAWSPDVAGITMLFAGMMVPLFFVVLAFDIRRSHKK